MKKKVFSKLLMVALVATVGAFTSCKDYDDDINDLRSQINGLETSLTTAIDQKTTSVANQVTLLEQQLEKVKADYAAADQALDTQLKALQNADVTLQGGIDANKAKIEGNLQAINDLKTEVASLYATKASLEAAKESLEKSLKETNDLLKAQGETIATLVAADQNLEKAINEAKALATKAQEAADAAQKAADKVAADLATLTTKEDLDIANLQKQITENLSSLTKKIDDMNAALDARITANTTKIDDLSKEVAKNYATIVYVDAQIEAVKKANEKVADELKTAKENLQKAITDGNKAAADALAAAQEALNKAIKDGDDAQAAALAAAQESLNKAIKDGDDAQAAALAATQVALELKIQDAADKAQANAELIAALTTAHTKDIELLTQKHDADMAAFIEEITGHTIPVTVAAEIKAQLPKFYTDSIKPYIDEKDAENYALIDALTKRFEADSVKMAAYLATEYLLTIKNLINDTADVVRAEVKATVGDLEKAYKKADSDILQAIADEKNAEKAGSLANLIETAKTSLGSQISTVDGKVATIEKFVSLATDDEGNFDYEKLAKSISDTKTLGDVIESSVGSAVDGAFDEVKSMITSINLFANQHHAQDDVYAEFDNHLIFTYAIEKTNIFPAADLQQYVDDSLKFVDGYVHTQTDKILVRVSPTNADLTKEIGNLGLFNSRGENIIAENIVKVVSVKRYDRPTYITRGDEGPETGLWEIEFKLKENSSDVWQKFEEKAFTKVNGEDKQILYAIGVRNTVYNDSAKKERYAISEYDLDLGVQNSFHSYDFTVNDELVANIHNRYIENENKPNNGATLWTDDKVNFPETYADELTYKFNYAKACEEDVPALVPADFTAENVENRFGHTIKDALDGVDNRHSKPVKLVYFENGWADITIDFPTTTCEGTRQTKIAGFYVTLDQDFARESNSSEITAWTSYWYDGVGFYCVNNGQFDAQRQDEQRGVKDGICQAKLFKGTNGTIRIKDYNSAKGDVIGFRVYAVNLDGTLYDPDGRAFYVKVGDEGTHRDLTFEVETFKAVGDSAKQKENITEINKNDEKFFNIKQTELNKGSYYTIDYVWADNAAQPVIYVPGHEEGVKPVAGTTGYIGQDLIAQLFKFTYSSKVGAEIDDDSWQTWENIASGSYEDAEAAYKAIQNVRVTLLAANRLVDNAKYFLTATVKLHQPDKSETVVNTIDVTITKTMPTQLPAAFMVRGAKVGADKNPIYDENVYLRPKGSLAPNNKPWNINTWFKANDKDSNYGWNKVEDKNLLWASDTRPYCLEEMFAGMISVVNGRDVIDRNYTFEFEGCGDFESNDSKANATSKYMSQFWNYALYEDMGHYALNPQKTSESEKHPRYTIPYVFNGVIGGDKVSVKAGYTYENISYNPDKEVKYGSDWVVAPNYFNAVGRFTTKDKAAFKVTFKCAIEPEFTLTATKNPVTVSAGQYTGENAKGKTIPYAYNFTVIPGSVSDVKVKWENTLPCYVRNTFPTGYLAKGASYHRARFESISSVVRTDVEEDGAKSYAKYSIAATAPVNNLVNNFIGVIRTSKAEEENELYIKSAKYQLKNGEADSNEYTIGEEELKHFYNITKNADGSWYFDFLNNTTVVGQVIGIQITFGSKTTSYDLIHQWGHVKQGAYSDGPADKTIYIGEPYSSGHIQSRQSR